MFLSCIVSKIFAHFLYPFVFYASTEGVPRLKFCHDVWCKKTTMMRYKVVNMYDDMFSCFSTVSGCVGLIELP